MIDFLNDARIKSFIHQNLAEDIGPGDYSTLSCIPPTKIGKARLHVKNTGIIAGIDLAKSIAFQLDQNLIFNSFKQDGDFVRNGDIAFELEGAIASILQIERLLLNCMQRLSGISTATFEAVELIKDLPTKILDTRKTTPGMRLLEKWAVLNGGGYNHRFGLFDMVMLKDNHIDAAGGIQNAIKQTRLFLEMNQLNLQIEVETRNLEEVSQVLEMGGVDRIMLDNFNPELLLQAVQLINKKAETEASGGITLETLRTYAQTGVDYISMGALTHSVKAFDLSLKIVK